MNRSQVEAYHCDVIPFCTTQWSERHLNKAEPEYSEFILWLFVTLNWNTRTVNYKTKGTMTSCGLHCLPDVYLHDDHSRLKPDRQSSCFTLSQNASKHIPLMFSKVKQESSWKVFMTVVYLEQVYKFITFIIFNLYSTTVSCKWILSLFFSCIWHDLAFIPVHQYRYAQAMLT